MKLIILLMAMFIANPAFAETCVNEYGGNNSCAEDAGHKTAGDCATLGYSATRCANGQAFLRCPFDKTKLRCIEYKVEEAKMDFSTLKDWSTQKPTCDTSAGDKLLTYTQDGKTYYRCVIWNVTCANFFGGSVSGISDWCRSNILTCDVNGVQKCRAGGSNRSFILTKKFRFGDSYETSSQIDAHYDEFKSNYEHATSVFSNDFGNTEGNLGTLLKEVRNAAEAEHDLEKQNRE